MQLPIIAHRGQTKPWPSIPRINWDHPLARNLVSYGYDIGCGPIDLVTGGQRTITNATNPPFAGPSASAYGSGLKSTQTAAITAGSNYTLPTSSNLANFIVAAPLSYAAGFMITTTPSLFSYLWNLGTASSVPVAIGLFNSVATDIWFGFGASTLNETAAGAVKINQYQTALGVGLTSSTTACYVDGALSISPAVTTTGAAVTGAKSAFIGSQSLASQTVPGAYIYYAALWKGRALTASEARLLHDDPYCFLIYPEDEMFAALVGGALAGSDDPVFCIAGDDGRSFTQMLGY